MTPQKHYFRHDREAQRSYFVIPPKKKDLLRALKLGLKKRDALKALVEFKAGVARVHPGNPKRGIAPDKFCRALGRQQAVKNAAKVYGLLETVIIEVEGVIYNVRVGHDRYVFFRASGYNNVKLDEVITHCYGRA